MRGITIISLVILIVVLLIIAGISISTLTGENSLIKRANQGKTETEKSNEKEEIGLAVVTSQIDNDGYEELNKTNLQKAIDDQFGIDKATVIDNGDGTFLVSFNNKDRIYKINSNGEISEKSEIPEGLEVGNTVTYIANNNTYIWQGEYSGEGKEANLTLSNEDVNYQIIKWNVYNLNDVTGTVELISNKPTDGKVFLGYAQGYNNAVYLLNEACNKLYGDSSKGITGRNINIEDIEEKMTSKALNAEEDSAHKYLNAYGYRYGSQANNEYTLNSSMYPSIYSQEELSVIDGIKNVNGIGTSTQYKLVEMTDTPTSKLQANKSIQPYHSNWYKNNAFMQNAFQSLENNSKSTYYDLIMPKGSNTSYWISTRVVGLYENSCSFSIRYINSGNIGAFFACSSYNNTNTDQGANFSLRPLISIDASKIIFDENEGWTIK